MAELSDRARELLAKQRERYLASLTGKHAELANLWEERQHQELDLIDAVHRIAGSAGLHGLDELQANAVHAEQTLRDENASEADREAAVRKLMSELEANASPSADG